MRSKVWAVPSEYFARNVKVGASLMLGADVALRDQIGIGNVMWGADYPHHEGTFPRTTLALRLLFADVSEDEVRAMTSLNAAELYGFDLDVLEPIAGAIGPTVAEVATPVSPDELPRHGHVHDPGRDRSDRPFGVTAVRDRAADSGQASCARRRRQSGSWRGSEDPLHQHRGDLGVGVRARVGQTVIP